MLRDMLQWGGDMLRDMLQGVWDGDMVQEMLQRGWDMLGGYARKGLEYGAGYAARGLGMSGI